MLKHVVILDTKKQGTKNENKNKSNNNDDKDKEKDVNRVETRTWAISDEELENVETQLLRLRNRDVFYLQHISAKLSNYRQQDILKARYNEVGFVSLDCVVDLLIASGLMCHYCQQHVFVLYKRRREQKQWSLDRKNNCDGHDVNNVLVSCLECNLRKRRIATESFTFTKQMLIIKKTDQEES